MKTTRSLKSTHSGAKQIFRGMALALAALLAHNSVLAETNAVDLAFSSGFAVLAGSGITIAGPVNSTVITGDIGTFPTPTITGLENLVLTGVNHAGDVVTQNAKTSLLAAYNDAAGRSATQTYGPIFDLGGLTLGTGIYNDPTSFAITGNLTLDAAGDPNAVWIFQAGSTLTTADSSQITLINGAKSANVFWQVGSSATLGTGSYLAGNILALGSITLNAGATVDGRALAQNGTVALTNNTLTVPEPSSILLTILGTATALFIRRRFPSWKAFTK